MQAVEPCGQEAPLKEVFLTLGFPESELTDLHNMEAVKWRLFCGVATLLIVLHGFWGVAVAYFWEETDRNLSAETTSVGPSTTSGGLSTEGWLQSGEDPSVWAP